MNPFGGMTHREELFQLSSRIFPKDKQNGRGKAHKLISAINQQRRC